MPRDPRCEVGPGDPADRGGTGRVGSRGGAVHWHVASRGGGPSGAGEHPASTRPAAASATPSARALGRVTVTISASCGHVAELGARLGRRIADGVALCHQEWEAFDELAGP